MKIKMMKVSIIFSNSLNTYKKKRIIKNLRELDNMGRGIRKTKLYKTYR